MSKDQTTWNERVNTIISHRPADGRTDALLCGAAESRWLRAADTEVGAGAVHLSYLSGPVSASNLHVKIYTRHICLSLAVINGCHVVL